MAVQSSISKSFSSLATKNNIIWYLKIEFKCYVLYRMRWRRVRHYLKCLRRRNNLSIHTSIKLYNFFNCFNDREQWVLYFYPIVYLHKSWVEFLEIYRFFSFYKACARTNLQQEIPKYMLSNVFVHIYCIILTFFFD